MSHEPSSISIVEARLAESERKLAECEKKLVRERELNLQLAEAKITLESDVARWRYQAENDMLTDLLRRGVFARKVARILMGRRHNEVPGSCLALLDVDRFKVINDVYGHPVGDKVLIGVGAVIKGAIREDDLACRIGDEFLIFFNRASHSDAERIAHHIADKVKTLRFDVGASHPEITTSVSYGVVMRSDSVTTYEELYDQADRLMYKMKEGQKNPVP